MKPFKISPQNSVGYLKWLLWLSVGLAAIYFLLAVKAYMNGKETWEWIINIGIGVIWLASGIFQMRGNKYYIPEITLSDSGITYKIKKSEKLVRWEQVKSINLDNNTIILRTESKDPKKLSITQLEYKELQTAKDRLREFADTYNVRFASKY